MTKKDEPSDKVQMGKKELLQALRNLQIDVQFTREVVYTLATTTMPDVLADLDNIHDELDELDEMIEEDD